jgi:hypothetical protein
VNTSRCRDFFASSRCQRGGAVAPFRLRALAAMIQNAATRVGDTPIGWALVELATALEHEAHLLEAALMRSRRAA